MKHNFYLILALLALAIPVRGAETVTANGNVITAPSNIVTRGSLTVSNGVTFMIRSSNGVPVTIYLPANAYTNALQIFDSSSNLVASISPTGMVVKGTVIADSMATTNGYGIGYFYSPDGTNQFWTNVVAGAGGGLTNGYSFDNNQFGANSVTNISVKKAAAFTNIVFFNSGGGPALSMADGASISLTNGNITVKSNGIVTIGDATGTAQLRFQVGAYISDYTGSESWNFKTAASGGNDSATVARLSDLTNGVVIASLNGLATNIIDFGWLKIIGNQTNSASLYIAGDDIVSGAVDANSLRVTGLITNSSLTASALAYADANKRVSSFLMANGALPIGSSGGTATAAFLTPINGINVINSSGAISIGLGASGTATNLNTRPLDVSGSGGLSLCVFSVVGSVTDTMRIVGTNGSTSKAVFDSNQLFSVTAPVNIWGLTTANTNLITGTNFQGSVGDVLTRGANGLFLATPTGGSGGSATNAIGNNGGVGTNTTLYGWTLFNGPFTNTSTTELQGSVSNGAALNVTGPLRSFNNLTNEGTFRQKGGQTNDANIRVVGAAEFQSSVTNTGPTMHGGATTNFSTTRNIGAVTNDSNVRITGALEAQSSVTNTGPTMHGGAVTNFSTTRNIGGVTNDANVRITGALEAQSTVTISSWSTTTGGVTNSSTVNNVGLVTNQSTVDVTGPLVAHGAATNRSTLRVMGGQTNDSNLRVVGNVEHQGTTTNTGPVMNASATTNFSTLRQIGGQTNDANLRVVGATEFQGATTNGAAVNIAGPLSIYAGNLTNVGTFRQMGAQTNDSTLRVTGNATLDGPLSFTWSTITLSDIDWSLGNSRDKTLAANTTFTFSNLQDDRDISVSLLQDATGTRTVTWPASIVWVNSTNQTSVPTVNTNAGYYSLYHFWRRSGTTFGEGPSTASSIFMVNLDSGAATSADLALAITDETGSGALVFGTSPTISGPTFSGNLVSQGAAQFQSTVNITGASTHGGVATFTNTIVGQAGENLTGALNVGGATILTNTVTAQAAVQAQSTVNITGASTFGGAATFTNAITGQSGENLTGALNVGGATILSNTLAVQNSAQFQAGANITGALNVGGATIFTNTVAAQTTVQAQAGVNITGALNVGGAVILTNTLTGQAAAQLQSTLNVTGAENIGGAVIATNTVTVQGAAQLQSTLNVTGAQNLGGLLTTTNGIANQSTVTNTGAANFAGPVTNWNSATYLAAIQKKPLLITSTTLTNQIDFTLQNSYRWTNMVTNIVLQLTNLIEGAEIDYYFTGGTNTGPNYTVYFTAPAPAGVNFRWGDGITNGPTSFTVTNNTRVTAFTKVWYESSTTNIESYFRYLPK